MSLTPQTCWALHGFLGRPADWARVVNEFQAQSRQRHQSSDLHFRPVDLLAEKAIGPHVDLSHWGAAFNSWVEQQAPGQRKVLMGYSMGGRLALEAFKADPSAWQKIFVLSSHPGLDSMAEKLSRQLNDEKWARRWSECRTSADFEVAIAEWNRQAVFDRSKAEPKRNFADYSMEALATATRNWSLTNQDHFRNWLSANPQHVQKIKWLVGEYDKKYGDLIRNLKSQFPALEVHVIPDAGHRVLLDNPYSVAELIF